MNERQVLQCPDALRVEREMLQLTRIQNDTSRIQSATIRIVITTCIINSVTAGLALALALYLWLR